MANDFDYVHDHIYIDEERLYDKIYAKSSWLYEKKGLNLNRTITDILWSQKIATYISKEEKQKFRDDLIKLLRTKYEKKYIKSKLISHLSLILKVPYSTFKETSLKELVEIFVDNAKLVKDQNGNWCFVNMLNTNCKALPDMLVYLIKEMSRSDIKEDKLLAELVYKRIMWNQTGIGLLELKPRMTELLLRYVGNKRVDYLRFVNKIIVTTNEGVIGEKLTIQYMVDYYPGSKAIYEGGHGDFIDMLFGCDLIIDRPGYKYITIQVKSYKFDDIIDKNNINYKNWVKKKCNKLAYKQIDVLSVVLNNKEVVLYDIRTIREIKKPIKEVLVEN